MDYLMMFVVFWFIGFCLTLLLGYKETIVMVIDIIELKPHALYISIVWPIIIFWCYEDYQKETRRKYADKVFDEMVLDRFKEQENAYRSDPSKYPQRW